MYIIGLDVGTQGARAICCDGKGNITAQFTVPFTMEPEGKLPAGWSEQNPQLWWQTARKCLQEIVKELKIRNTSTERITALAVTSTSGTILPIREDGIPLRAAIMYNDTRAVEEAQELNEIGKDLTEKLGYRFSSSFALAKILWVKRHEPKIFDRTWRFIHAADYIVGKLTGRFDISDISNTLKTGYDHLEGKWPTFIERSLGIATTMLPQVLNIGETIAPISHTASQEVGLSSTTVVVAGATDGTASFFASGATRIGDWNSTLGTTLVVRGVSRQLVKDSKGRIYCHRHPQGYWLPGGASSTGGECLKKKFAGENLEMLDKKALQRLPTNLIVYPLVRKGERLPFQNPEAEGFVIGESNDQTELYAAYLEGVGYVERWIYEILEELGAEVGNKVFVTGGGAKSQVWLKIRASILGKQLVRPLLPEAAMGAAVIAASRTFYENIDQAVQSMIRHDLVVEPQVDLHERYQKRYGEFRKICAERGYE